MADAPKQGGKKGRKVGRMARKPTHKEYNASHRRERNKIKRILKSNGPKSAEQYASAFEAKFGMRLRIPTKK